MVEYTQITTTTYTLTEEGSGMAKDGSHEYRLWSALEPKGGKELSVPELQVSQAFFVLLLGPPFPSRP